MVAFMHSRKDVHINSIVTHCRRPEKLLLDKTVTERGDWE